jgi:hypothetical protein
MAREALVQHEILKAWGAHPAVRLWRQNTGVAKMGDRSVRFGLPGCADILGLIGPSGRFLAIEVKSPTGRQSEEQKRFERVIKQWGGVYVLARSVADVDAALGALGIGR